jgi:predicted nucleic-acid-binding protein
VFVLESAYRLDRNSVAELMRSVIAFDSIRVINEPLLLRALERYESLRLHFVDSYLVACAELFPNVAVASFDRSIDRASAVQRIEP